MNHFIEKIIVDLEINDRKDAFNFQNKVSKLFEDKLQKITENILDEFSNSSSVIKFSNIEIDLGNIRSTSFEKDFIAEYEKQLRAVVSKSSSKNKKIFDGSNFRTSSTTSLPTEHNEVHIFKFFLENGRLPNQVPKEFNIDELFNNILKSQKALTLQTIKPLLNQKKVIHRLIYSFSIHNTEQFLKYLLPKTFGVIQIAINNVFSVLKINTRTNRQQKLHKQLLLNVVEIIQSSKSKTDNSDFDLEKLHTTFLNYLPQYWQQATTPIYSSSFSLKKPQNINTEQVSLMTYKDLKQVLKQAENRHKIVSKSTQKQLLSIINTLSGNKSEALKKLIRKSLQESRNIDTKKVKNIIWSIVLKYLTTKKSPTYIDIVKVEKIINDNSILIEIEKQNSIEQQIIKQELKQKIEQKITLETYQDTITVSYDNIDINKVLELSYAELKTLLEQKKQRYQIVLKSSEKQLIKIIDTLSEEKTDSIYRIIKKTTNKKVKNIDKNIFKHLIWSTTLEHLITFNSPSEIRITEVKKNIQSNRVLLESNRKNQQKLRQEKRELENLQKEEEELERLSDSHPKHPDSLVNNMTIPEILDLSFEELIDILKQKEKRQQIIVTSSEKELRAIISTLSTDKSESILKIIEKTIYAKAKSIDFKTRSNVVWSVVLEKLTTYDNTAKIKLADIEEVIEKSLTLLEKITIPKISSLSFEELRETLKQKEKIEQVVVKHSEEQLFEIINVLSAKKSESILKIIEGAIKKGIDDKEVELDVKSIRKSVWSVVIEKLTTYKSPAEVSVNEIEKSLEENQEILKKIDIDELLALPVEAIKATLTNRKQRQRIIIRNTEEKLFAIIAKVTLTKSESILKIIDETTRQSTLIKDLKTLKNAVWSVTLEYIATQKSQVDVKVEEIKKVINKSRLILEANIKQQQEIKDLRILQKQQDKAKVNSEKSSKLKVEKSTKKPTESTTEKSTGKINIDRLLSSSLDEIRNTIKQKEKRQQVVVNSTEKQISKLIKLLAVEKSDAILKIVSKAIPKAVNKETKTLENLVWSMTLEYLSMHLTPSAIKLAEVKKTVQNASVIVETNPKEQQKLRQEKRELQKLQKLKEKQEVLEDIYQNKPDGPAKIINIPEILDLSIDELRVLLEQRGSRQQIVIKSTDIQLQTIVKTFAEDKKEAILKIIEKAILKGANNIDYKTFRNIVWSTTLSYLAAVESSAEVKISEIKEAINNSKNILEKNYQEQQEIQELKKIIEVQENQSQEVSIENEGEKLNILKLLKLSYEELKKLLFKKENRYQIVTKSSADQLFEVINILSNEYSDDINELVKTIIDKNQNDLPTINPITLKNVVWLVVLEYLLTTETPKDIKLKTIEKSIIARLKRIEAQHNIIYKSKEETENEQDAAKDSEQTPSKEIIEDIAPKIIKLNYRVEDILEVYLLEGYFIQPLESHEILIKNLLDNQPRQLRILLTRIGKTTTIIQRLVDKISANTLQRLTKLLVSDLSLINVLKNYIDKQQISHLYQTAIQHQLQYGQVEPTFLFDEFVNNQFDGIDLTTFVQSIYNNLKANSETELLTIIDNYLATIIVIDTAVEEDKFSATRTLDFLMQHIDNPSNNWWLKNIDKPYINRNFQSVIDYYPDSVKTFFYKIAAKKNAAEILTTLLQENNLTLLMNLIEPNLFGYISTIILTFNGFIPTNESWKLALTAYFNTPKPLNINTFTQQAYLQLANRLGNSSSKTQEKILEYAEKQIKAKQQRFFALKQIILNDRRLKKQPQLLTEPDAAEFPNIESQPTASNIEIISYYLKYNTLPIGFQHIKEEDIVYRIKKQGFENVNILKIAIRKILDNPAFSKQLTSLPDNIIHALIHALQPRVGLFILPYIKDLRQVVENKILILSALKVANEVTILAHRAGFIQHFVFKMLDTISTTVNMTFDDAVNNIIDDLTDKPQQSNIVKQLRRVLVRSKKEEEEATIDTKPTPVVEKTAAPLKDTTIYIDNAGVVMLNVFFPFLFKMFNLTEGREFVDFEASCKAAYMIYYISSGNPAPAEHQLILSKIMCGIPIEQPINTVITLTEEEQAACNQLIQASINRWARMKNASVEGFRNSFLKREGKLVKISKGWTLSVEQKPFDLLMKTLPWGFSMVKFGWMDTTIYVEWAY